MRKIKIFDTTLRDGEQSPGVNLNLKEKMIIAKRLENLGVDIIEAGFPMASEGDFKSVSEIAKNIKNSEIAALSRAVKKDIDLAWNAVKYSESPRIHTFIATSPIHMKYKLKMSEEQVIENAIEAVKYSKNFCSNIEFSAEDAYRSEVEFLCRLFENVIEAGATVINIPDTVGYALPMEYGEFIKKIVNGTKGIEKVDVSVHCHNDLGLAVANSLSGVLSGATQVECAINGLGERAGNTALEEIVMAIETKKESLDICTGINLKNIWGTSKLVSSVSGMYVQNNKAIVGENAFLHESGIHQDGFLKERSTYEIITPETIGRVDDENLILGKHSGRHAFKDYLKKCGLELEGTALDEAFERFKSVADKKKNISPKEIEAIVNHEISEVLEEKYKLISYQIYSGNKMICTSTVEIQCNGVILKESAVGEGTISSVFKAVERCIGKEFNLKDYSIKSITDGEDSLGEIIIKIEKDGKIFTGRSLSEDVMEASVKAYISAINKICQ